MSDRIAIIEGPLGADWCQPADLCHNAYGAITSFLGVVRDNHNDRGVTHLEYECYGDMAKNVLQHIIQECRDQFDPEARFIVAHGYGHMVPGECSVAIHVATAHRVAAFDACRHIIERIKEDLPVWKNEFYDDGTSLWLKGS